MSWQVDKDFLHRTASDLVRIDSVNPSLTSGGAGESEIVRYIAGVFDRLSIPHRILSNAPGRPSIVGTIKGSGGGRSLMLNAHIDTVGVDGMKDPFSGAITEGRLYGRGAQDMKASVAAGIEVARMIKQRDTPLAGDLHIACVADEEYASIGSFEVADEFAVGGVIVTEPTDMTLCLAHKGFIWIEIVTHGKAAHGSRPDEGVDANAMMGLVISRIHDLAKSLAAGPAHPLVGPGSIHVPIVSGGQAMSIYSPSCMARLERRTIPGETGESVMNEILSILEDLGREHQAFEASAKLIMERAPFEQDPDCDLVNVVQTSFETANGSAAQVNGASFWCDAAIFKAKGVDAVIVGPVGDGLHTVEEWVDLASVEQLALVLADTAERFGG